MLEMDEGRVSFSDALRPREGYQIEFAVGTTYSLDLRALLGLCIPLGLGFEPEELATVNPVSLFAALQRLQGKLAIFCDKGNIKADISGNSKTSGLLMLLEGMIHQVHVNTHRKDGLSSFHPKVWVVKYVSADGGDPLYRLMVMSRNLTFDTSWDVVAVLDGHCGAPNDCGSHVADFLEFLAEGDAITTTERDDARRKDSHTTKIRRLAEEVRSVEFEYDTRLFDSIDFLPFGPHDASGRGSLMSAWEQQLFTWMYRNVLVVSPFLSDGAGSPLASFQKRRSTSPGRFILISREDSLAKIDESLREAYECYAPVSSLADVELDGEGDVDAANYSDLHAKVYFVEALSSKRSLYLGSLNASYNGTVNNVEALICLGVRPHHLTFADLIKPLIGSSEKDKPPFAPYVANEVIEQQEDTDRELGRQLAIAAKLLSFRSAVVDLGDDGAASLSAKLEIASAAKACGDITLRIHPLLSSEGMGVELTGARHVEELLFDGLAPEQVSGLFVLEGRDPAGNERSCVLVCPHDRFDDSCLTLEERSRILVSSILTQNNGALTQYIAHAFDLPEASYATSEGASSAKSGLARHGFIVPPGLYERLLEMADADPMVFRRASNLMALIPHEVKSDELDRLNKMIESFIKAVG